MSRREGVQDGHKRTTASTYWIRRRQESKPPSKVEGGRVNAQAEALPPPHHANANARVAMATTMPAVVKAGGSHDRLAA